MPMSDALQVHLQQHVSTSVRSATIWHNHYPAAVEKDREQALVKNRRGSVRRALAATAKLACGGTEHHRQKTFGLRHNTAQPLARQRREN
jgi:hypothetical protein